MRPRRPANGLPVLRLSIPESKLLRQAYEAEQAGNPGTYVGEAAEKLASRACMVAVSIDGATYTLTDLGRALAKHAADYRAAMAAR